MSSADVSLSRGSIVRDVADVVIRRPLQFILLPWILVTASSMAVWGLGDRGLFRWLLDVAGGWVAEGTLLLLHLIFALVATSPLIVLAAPNKTHDQQRVRISSGSAVRRLLEITLLSTAIATTVVAILPVAVILSVLGLFAGPHFPLLLVAIALACSLTWILATLSVALPVAAIEGLGLGSLRRSWMLTRGHRIEIATLAAPLVALIGLLWHSTSSIVIPPLCPSCTLEVAVEALQRLIDIGARRLALAIGLGIAMVMMTRIYLRLVEINGELPGGAVQDLSSTVGRAI